MADPNNQLMTIESKLEEIRNCLNPIAS